MSEMERYNCEDRKRILKEALDLLYIYDQKLPRHLIKLRLSTKSASTQLMDLLSYEEIEQYIDSMCAKCHKVLVKDEGSKCMECQVGEAEAKEDR